MPDSQSWTAAPEDVGSTVTAFVRKQTGVSWKEAKRWVATGKVFVGDRRIEREDERVRAGMVVALRMRAPRPGDKTAGLEIAFEDAHVVVVNKPAGVSSVPYHAKESGTAMDLLREVWRRQKRKATETAVHIVHRIDKDTSGLLAFAKSKRAERGLQAQLRTHAMERTYLCVAHGMVSPGRIESRLVVDRGDGLRGSARRPNEGKRAVTHVAVRERLPDATLCEVRLETGKTHQIRIHFAEFRAPLVGERVYIRDYSERGGRLIESPRLLLHAATLGFEHPVTGARVALEAPLPADFIAVLDRLRAS